MLYNTRSLKKGGPMSVLDHPDTSSHFASASTPMQPNATGCDIPAKCEFLPAQLNTRCHALTSPTPIPPRRFHVALCRFHVGFGRFPVASITTVPPTKLSLSSTYRNKIPFQPEKPFLSLSALCVHR